MASEIVTGLSGPEIKKDYLSQLSTRLDRDCNLRDSDSYNRGYSGWIEYHLECYGLDTVVVEGKVSIGTPQEDPDAEIAHGKIEIAKEEDLGVVRDRIDENSDKPAEEEEPTLAQDHEGQTVNKRRYNRRLPIAQGGAEDVV